MRNFNMERLIKEIIEFVHPHNGVVGLGQNDSDSYPEKLILIVDGFRIVVRFKSNIDAINVIKDENFMVLLLSRATQHVLGGACFSTLDGLSEEDKMMFTKVS